MSNDNILVGIVGGGVGGVGLLAFLADNPKATVKFVTDVKTDAPACATAKKLGIPTFTNIADALKIPTDLIFDATGNPNVEETLVRELHGSDTQVVSGKAAYHIIDLMRATAIDDDEEDTLENRYLILKLAEEEYGVEIAHVKEIVGVPHISSIPEMPEYVVGVVNLRGSVIPVVDLRIRFHIPKLDYSDRTATVIVSHKKHLFGLVVDTVVEVLDIPANNLTPPPQVASGASHRYLRSIGRVNDNVKLLLDIETILEELATSIQ
jgi:purine-binding chemotaxis protein CheW